MRFIRHIFQARAQPTSSLESDCRPVMVVGMHRSGTSFLTGSLQQAGLELGEISAWNPHNLKGNRENNDIVAFNDAVLAARDHAWDNPPQAPIEWTAAERAHAESLIAGYGDISRWGFKDPRTLLLLEGWQALIPDLAFVGIFRHPGAVAESLNARGGMAQEKAFSLWHAYNERLLRLHQRQPFPLLCFDESEQLLHDKLNTVLIELGLPPLGNDRFFSAELKHHQQQSQALPKPIARMYQELRRRAR